MKKHFLYLSTAALLAMSFASCVDNDEPKGLEYLRYARANKWDADAEKVRALIEPDSLYRAYEAQAKKAEAIAAELVNLKQEAKDKCEIEERQCSSAVLKAQYDVQLAQQKFELAKLETTNAAALAEAKANLANKEAALITAENALYNAQAQKEITRKEYDAAIAAREAALKNTLLEVQKTIDNNKISVAEWAAELEAKTYKSSIKNLLIIAAAHKDAWEQNNYKVSEAYTLLKTKEGNVITARKELELANQELLVAINTYEKDSVLNKLQARKDAVTKAQYLYDKEQKNVVLAQAALDEFKEVSKGDVEAWNKAYNDLETEIATLKKQVSYKEVDILEAEKARDVANTALTLKKDEVEKPLNDFNDKVNYYTFVMDDAIVYDVDGNEQFTYANGEFKTEKGVIANAKGVANKDLHTNLDNYLTQIGGSLDRNKIGKTGKYMDETRIKAVESEINALVKENEGKDKTLETFVTKYNAKISEKVSDSLTNEQKLKELKVQDEPKTKYEKDLATFTAAVKAYQDSVAIYKWSDQNGKSTVYEKAEADLVELGKAYVKKYNSLSDAEKLSNTDLNTMRTNIQTKLNAYWNTRKGFDGAYAKMCIDPSKVKEYVLDNTLADDTKKGQFDGIVASIDYNANPVDLSALLRSNNRESGKYVQNDKEFDAGKWTKYVTAAKDLLGIDVADNEANLKIVAYSENEINQFKANSWAGVSGSMVDFYKYEESKDKLQENIDKAHDNQDVVVIKADGSIDYDAIYADGGTVQLREAIAYKTEEINKEKAENDEKIANKQNDIANNDFWKDLYEDIADVLDAYDDELKALTIAQQDAYNTELTPLQEAYTKAVDKVKKLGLEKDELELTKGVKEAVQGKYQTLINDAVDPDPSQAELKAEIIIEFAILDLERNIETAKEELAKKKIALENAQRDLEDFDASEYSTDDNYGLKTLLTQMKNVNDKQVAYDQAVKELEVAQTYFDEVMAAFEAE